MVVTNTTTYVLVTCIVVFVIYKIRQFIRNYTYWQRKNVPSITPLIPIGNTLDILLGKMSFGELFSKAYLEFQRKGYKHGGVYYFWQPIYVPVDPDIIKSIMISDFENFTNHGLYIAEDDPLSLHLFNMENKRWKDVREKLPAAFTSAKMREMYTFMDKYSNVFKSNLDKYAEEARPVEMKGEVSRFTTDVTSACIFGLESKTMRNQNLELLKHGRLFTDYQWHVLKNTLVMTIPRPILQFFKFRIFTKETEKYMFDLFEGLRDNRKANGVSRNDMADIIIKLSEHGKDKDSKNAIVPLTPGEFVAQMFIFFGAGFETSSTTQSFALYELAKNQDCQTRLRNEIKTVLAKYDNKLSYDAIADMKYLDSVINETLRSYPVIPILPRVCKNDYHVPGTDVVLEKNTAVIITNLGIQHDPEYYPDAERFDPDRFSSEIKYSRPVASYLPFGAGPRVCIGKRFGLLQAKLGVITVIKNFEITLNEKTEDGVKFVTKELVLRKEGGVWLNLKKLS